MTATALLKFDQGPNSAAAGVALVGTLDDGQVLVSNGNNTDVARWIYTLLYVPPGSAIPTGLKLDSTVVNFTTFTPDVDGPYRWELEVRNSTGTVIDRDIRVFAIREPRHGYIIPPYQKDPDPLPTLASGDPAAKPNELNFFGLEFGWAGDENADMLHQVIRDLDASNFDMIPRVSDLADKALILQQDSAFNFPTTAVLGAGYVWIINQNTLLGGFAGFAGMPAPDARLPSVTYDLSGSSNYVLHDAVEAGAYVWAAGEDTGGAQALISRLTPPGGPVATTLIAAATAFNNLEYGNGYLWAGDTSGSGLYRIDPASPSGPYTTILVGDNVFSVYYDNVNTYGDSNPRLLVTDITDDTLKSVKVVGSPSVDSSFSDVNMTVPTYSCAGGGFIWLTAFHTGVPRIRKIDPSTFTLVNSATLGAINIVAYGVRYAAGKVWVVGSYDAGGGGTRGVVVSVNPSTLAVIDTIYLGGSVNSDASLRLVESILWVAHLSFNGSVLSKIDPSTADLTENLNLKVGYGRPVPGLIELDLLTTPQNTSDTAGYKTIGGRFFNPSDYSLREGDQVTWDAIIETTNVANSADLELYNVTDAGVVANVSSTSLTPEHKTTVLTVGTDLPMASKWYELLLKMGAGGVPDVVTCRTSKLIVNQ